jgi:replicative DNA helicase
MYYNSIRKYSLLRQLEQNYNITEFWDKNKSDETNQKKISKYTIEEVINYFDKDINKFKRDFLLEDEETNRKKAGENGHQILLNFKDRPTMGLAFESKYLTTLWDGCQKKQLYIRSGDTSSGKSRSGIGDLGCLCVPEIYDLEQKKWVENPNGKNRGLYIGCEMQLDTEVDPLMWSYVSGIDSSTIMRGEYTEEEKKIINKAIDVVNDDCMWLVDMPSFNIQKLENEIKQYKLDCNIDYVCFDYMLITNSLVKEFSQSRGGMGGFRGDEILLELSKALKDICKKYNVAMLTMTQVNADIKDFKNRDYQVLRGGKAVADKATGGSISMPITQQELKLIEPYLKKRGFENKIPNFVETVYKARWSEYPKECKIFSYYNLGNMRKEELFVTDKNFMPIKLEKTIIKC